MEKNNLNNSEENNKSNKKNNLNNKQKFLNDFCDEKLTDKWNKNIFLDLIFNSKEILWDLKNNLETKLSDDNYGWLDLKDIKLSDLKNKLSSDYITLKFKREKLENNILEDYKINSKEINIIWYEISKLTDENLNSYLNSEKKNLDFIKSILRKDISKKDNIEFSSIIPLSSKEYENRLNKLNNENDKQQIKTIFEEFRNWKLSDLNLKILIELDFLNNSEKKKIVENFIPTISLNQAEKLWLIEKTEIKDKKNKLLWKYFDSIEWLDKSKKEEIIDQVNSEDISISTKSFLSDDNVLKLADKVWFKNIETEIDDIIEENNEKSEKDWPSTFQDFKDNLASLSNAIGIDNFKENSILRFSHTKEWKVTERYFRYNSINDSSKTIWMTIIWSKEWEEEKTKIKKEWKNTENKKYYEILDFLNTTIKWANNELKIYNKNEFNELIDDDEKFDIIVDSVNSITKDNLTNNPKLKDKLQSKLISKYNSDLSELEDELEKLIFEKKWLKWLSDKKEDSKLLDVKINNLNQKISDKKNEIENISEDILDDDSEKLDLLVAHNNFTDLLDKLNWVDSEWKSIWFKKWIIIKSNNWESKWSLFEISWINNVINWTKDDETIELKNSNGELQLTDYDTFFKAFKSNKAFRIEKITDFDEIINSNSFWEKFKFKNNELIQKWVEFNWKKEDKKIDYLHSKKWKIIKIESIWNWKVEVKEWKYKEWNQDEKTNNTNNKIELEKDSRQISLNELDLLVKGWPYTPDWKIWKNYTIEDIEWYDNKIKESWWTKYLNNLSINELFMWWKMIVTWIEDYLKRWNEVKSAEFALKLSKFIPWEFKEDFFAQTEMKTAEAMENELKALWEISSMKASLRIKSYLENKDTPEYKKEAWLIFVASYWNLYPKGLAKCDKSFLWYEALWWKIGDEMYEKEKSKAENAKEPLPFDEKELIISLLWAQSSWNNKIVRRSKFNKKFKWAINGWFSDELTKWVNDAKEKRNIADIIDGWYWEIFWNTLANALWWAKESVNKWWSLKEMNELYFVMINSWILYDAWSNLLTELKNQFVNEWNSMIFASFWSTLDWQKLMNKTVLDVSIQISEVDWDKYPWIAKDAREIFTWSTDSSIGFKTKVNKTKNFWSKYWEVLSRTLYMADDKDASFAKTDKLIQFWKDWIYSDYYNAIKTWTWLKDSLKQDWFEYDAWENWATWLDNFEIVRRFIVMDNNGSIADRYKDVAAVVWPSIWNDINSTKEKIDNSPENEWNYKEYLNHKLREIVAWLLTWAWEGRLAYLEKIDPVWLDLASIWIKMSDFKWMRKDAIKKWEVWSEIFNNAVSNIIWWNRLNYDELWTDSIFWITDNTKDEVNNTIDKESGLDDNDWF